MSLSFPKSSNIYMVNVGSNASHNFCSPLFPDGRFEFLPIPEDRELSKYQSTRYKDLKSYYNANSYLTQFIPKQMLERTAHNDPEFNTFTYGDNCDINSRAAGLKSVKIGDYIVFIVRLCLWINGRFTSKYGFYLIGFLEIEEILPSVTNRPNKTVLEKFAKNAHVLRGQNDDALWDSFWIFKGSEKSQRFEKAVPITKGIASQVFRQADGRHWKWPDSRSDLQIIGSYTRSCRRIIEANDSEEHERATSLSTWISKHYQ